jgi:hypothetical protein
MRKQKNALLTFKYDQQPVQTEKTHLKLIRQAIKPTMQSVKLTIIILFKGFTDNQGQFYILDKNTGIIKYKGPKGAFFEEHRNIAMLVHPETFTPTCRNLQVGFFMPAYFIYTLIVKNYTNNGQIYTLANCQENFVELCKI